MESIPRDSNSLDFVTAYNFIEHIPRIIVSEKTRFPFIELMSEIHRVLKLGGLFYSKTPANAAFQHPAHVNIITNEPFPIIFVGILLVAPGVASTASKEILAS